MQITADRGIMDKCSKSAVSSFMLYERYASVDIGIDFDDSSCEFPRILAVDIVVGKAILVDHLPAASESQHSGKVTRRSLNLP